MARGRLRVYLGAAPGVGKTYAMLGEGRRRAERGTDVVVGLVEDHGRARTREMAAGLEQVPRRTVAHRGVTLTEMDLDAVLARHPAVALVDELAHTNAPGSRHEKRWQDVEELLAAGIDVISTVNVQHLESLNDVVEKITGVPQRERIPDAVVRAADQIEIVDMAPEALRRRMAHGNVYEAGQVDAALSNYFRVGNLTALRELALLWMADEVDEALQRYRAAHDIDHTWEARERVVVALTGGPEGETLVRRAARIAARATGGDLLAVHVTRSDGLTGADPARLSEQRRLVETLGGSYHQVVGDDVAEALLAFARAENATQLVLGVSRRSRVSALLTGPGIGFTTTRRSGDIDVHLVSHAQVGRGRLLPELRGSLTRRRRIQGYALAVALPPALTVALASDRTALNLVSDVLLFLLATVVVALVGGMLPAVLAAIAGSLLLNYFFTPPLHTFTIGETNNTLALAVFVVVAVLVSSVVDLAARRTRQAARATAESETLGTLAGSVLRGETALPALLERVRESFSLDSVTLLERVARRLEQPGLGRGRALRRPGRRRQRRPCRRRPAARTPWRAATRRRPAADRGIRRAGGRAARAAATGRRRSDGRAHRRSRPDAYGAAGRRRARPAHAARLGHRRRHQPAQQGRRVDPRGPARPAPHRRGVARTAVPAGRQPARPQPPAGRRDGRGQPPVALDEVVPLALDSLGPVAASVRTDVPDDLPEVDADPGLLERVVANLVSNALRHSPPDVPPAGARERAGRAGRAARRRPGSGRRAGRPRRHLRAVPAAG